MLSSENEFERARAERIAENARRMAQMGITTMARDLVKIATPVKAVVRGNVRRQRVRRAD